MNIKNVNIAVNVCFTCTDPKPEQQNADQDGLGLHHYHRTTEKY